MNLGQFSEVYALLAAQLRHPDVDAPFVRAYFKVLQDLEPEFVVMAADRFSKGASVNDQGEAWFPKAPEWRALARKVELEREAELRGRLRKLREPLCAACADTGWRTATELLTGPVTRCECRDVRRLEVLGRRPMPELASGDAA